jgi:hypothetical protein
MGQAHIDSFRQIELFLFDLALLLVFTAWLTKHVWHEIKPLVKLLRRSLSSSKETVRGVPKSGFGGRKAP